MNHFPLLLKIRVFQSFLAASLSYSNHYPHKPCSCLLTEHKSCAPPAVGYSVTCVRSEYMLSHATRILKNTATSRNLKNLATSRILKNPAITHLFYESCHNSYFGEPCLKILCRSPLLVNNLNKTSIFMTNSACSCRPA